MVNLPRRIARFIMNYWYIPALIIVAVVAWLVLRKTRWGKDDPLKRITDELRVITAGQEARETQIQVGTDQAIEAVRAKYEAKTQALDAQQQQTVKELEDDPVALARYLERITR